MKVDLVADKGEAEGVALAHKEFDEDGSGIDGEGELVGLLETAMAFEREQHGTAVVDDDMATEVGLFGKAFDKEFVGTAIELPVDVFGRLAGVVEPMFGKLDREAVKRALVETGNKALDNLTGEEIQRFVFL